MRNPLRRMSRRVRNLILTAVLTALMLTLPLFASGSQLVLIIGILVVAIFAYAWHPVGGVMGELSFAQAISWGAGGYSMVLAVNGGLEVWQAVIIGCVAGAVVALVVVIVATMAKLRGLYVAVFTLIFAFFAVALASTLVVLGKGQGIQMVSLPFSVEQSYLSLAVFAGVVMAVNVVILTSRRGLVWLAMRDDPATLPAFGQSPNRERIFAYVVTGAMCGIGGGLYTTVLGFASPETSLSFHLVVAALLAVYVGGPGTIWGPLVGVIFLEGLGALFGGQNTSETALWASLAKYAIALVVVILVATRRDAIKRYVRSLSRRMGQQSEQADVVASRTVASPGEGPASIQAILGRHESHGPLEVRGLAKSFGGSHVLRDVSFSVTPGEVLSLVGPNGAGKSTICNIIAGVIRPDQGSVALGDTSIERLPEQVRTRLGLARSFQTPRIFTRLTFEENLRVAGSRNAREVLAYFDLNPLKPAHLATLMERRLLEIARLVSQSPKWVLLDEPLAGLDLREQELVMDFVAGLADAGASVLLIEHLIPVIAPRVDRMIVLDRGVLIADGAPAEVLHDQRVVEAYLGQPVDLVKGEGS